MKDAGLRTAPLLMLALLVLFPWALARGDDDARTAALKSEYRAQRKDLLREAGTRHVKVGIWCRDAGLVAQAASEFIRAVEVSEGENDWAERILALMRNLDDRFWRKRLKKPSPGMIRGYEKRARQASEAYQKDRLRLARWADKKGLEDEALAEYKAVVRLSDDFVQVNEKGLVVVDAGTVPEPYSGRLLADAVTINGNPRVRDEFLEKLPQVKEVHETASEELLVRSELGPESAADLHAICQALLPFLEEDLGGRPTRRLRMFVFKARTAFEAYLEASDMKDHKAATGVADGGAFVTLVCGEGLDAATVQGVALHELTHLFQYGVTPTVMPSWFNEGFAETYGGAGSFTWDGKVLKAGLPMPDAAVAGLRADATYIPLERLLAGDALKLINENRTSARVFYDEAWAFFQFLRTGAGKEVAERFEQYALVCRGAALGAKAGQPHNRDAADAAAYFRKVFGAELPALETAFRAWIASYGK